MRMNIRRYMQQVKTFSAHERREFSIRAAGVITGVLFIIWLATFSLRLVSTGESQNTNTQNTAATLFSVEEPNFEY